MDVICKLPCGQKYFDSYLIEDIFSKKGFWAYVELRPFFPADLSKAVARKIAGYVQEHQFPYSIVYLSSRPQPAIRILKDGKEMDYQSFEILELLANVSQSPVEVKFDFNSRYCEFGCMKKVC